MTASSDCLDKVTLLMDVLPKVATESAFAVRGGTAINMFYQKMPRLSVNIDLTWLPVADRSSSLRNIDRALKRIVALIRENNSGIHAQYLKRKRTTFPRIIVNKGKTFVTIATSTVVRGTVLPSSSMMTFDSVTKYFRSMQMNVVSFEDAYSGKICAALERKYPHDLFDVMMLYNNGGLTDDLFRVLMVYAACSSQPMHKVLSPSNHIQKGLYDPHFGGLAEKRTSLESLIETGKRLHSDIASRLSGKIATFLLTLHDAEPDFGLIGFPKAAELPAIRWKIFNLKKIKNAYPEKHARQRRALEALLH